MPRGKTFQERTWDIVRQVPAGRVITYGQIARLVGGSHLARTVGYAMARCPNGVPWHRVVNAQGRISVRRASEGMAIQRALLASEGVAFQADDSIDLRIFGFRASLAPPARGPGKRRAPE
jgi:methylated-DNA-protein-cysteine methyltransferase-like protein